MVRIYQVLTITEMILVQCNIDNNQYLRDSWVLSTLFANKSFGQLSNISPVNHIYTQSFRV